MKKWENAEIAELDLEMTMGGTTQEWHEANTTVHGKGQGAAKKAHDFQISASGKLFCCS